MFVDAEHRLHPYASWTSRSAFCIVPLSHVLVVHYDWLHLLLYDCFLQRGKLAAEFFNFNTLRCRDVRVQNKLHRSGPVGCRHCFYRGFLFEDCFFSCLGYPGEGPNSTWSILSANISSMTTNKVWKTWEDNVLCLQETRVGKNNARTIGFQVHETGRKLFPGSLLPGLQLANGTQRTQHGGTAVLAPEALTCPFLEKHDCTGLYAKLFATKRVVAVWHQISTNVRMLVWSVYARTSASSDPQIMEYNDVLFADIFSVSAQFGNIPILITGDFQSDPLHYPSISHAIHFMSWFDPLQTVDANGEISRPITFSKDGCFSGMGDGCSSIDAIIMNQTAFSALRDAYVVEIFGVQHRPVRAEFQWNTIFQVGSILQLPATFDITGVPCKKHTDEYRAFENNARETWEKQFQPKFENAPNHEDQWAVVNQALISTLLQGGAKWNPGKQERGRNPSFHTKQFCPGQLPLLGAATVQGSKMKNCLNRLSELRIRLERGSVQPQDHAVTKRTAVKTWWQLKDLSSPFLWVFPHEPMLIDIFANWQWLDCKFRCWEQQRKLARVNSWREKIKSSAQSNKSYIFHHLRNKARDEPANLVVNDAGNILFDPKQALSHINTEWDSVFSANCLHEHPLKVLEVVWPYIQHEVHQFDVPDLTGADLYAIIQKRKTVAAPGLDGWRTCELQALPITAFEGVAAFFRCLEHSECPIPSILATAKQKILNKNGDNSPLQKRLITILPALLLSYTGARFQQLQSWQSAVMPPQLYGAIKGRYMTTIPNSLRLELDEAKTQNSDMIGLKLDKAKCFDRIVPSLTAALFLAFGIPQKITNVFIKIYNSLKRHLAYKNWISPDPTTACNGVAQGCSFSLLAINVHMKVWVSLLSHLPHITIKAFIDDAYLWAHVQHVQELENAIQITKTWDLLCGQLLNDGKSVTWGTSTTARKVVKTAFPLMKLLYEVDVLGTLIYTSNRNACGFSVHKLTLIQQEARSIAALPISRQAKENVISSRLIPRCTFTAAISQIPQGVLSKINAAVTASLWYKRPMWRSKWLVLGLLAQPHRIEPETARAYTALCDFARFIQLHPNYVPICQRTLATNLDDHHGFMFQIVHAFKTFGFRVFDDFTVSYRNGQRISLVDLPPSYLKPVLRQLSRHVCYVRGCEKKRKDTSTPKGVLDFDLTSTFWKHSKLHFDDGLPAPIRFESHVVGCLLSNDRLHAAQLSETDLCRFCNSTKETLSHLLDCPAVALQLGKHINHDFGENFRHLGIFEHPPRIVEHRLQCSCPTTLQTVDFLHPEHVTMLWTDGSVHWSDHYWLTSAGFAVIQEDGQCLAAGPVFCWHLTSYSAELWALIVAIVSSSSCLHIFSDCKSVVDHFREMLNLSTIPFAWPHRPWWLFLQAFVQQRCAQNPNAVTVSWIPAHLYENVPIALITSDMAKAAKSTVQHIELNRRADFRAKQEAASCAAVDPLFRETLQKAILQHQEWLTVLNHNIAGEHAVHTPAEHENVLDAPGLTISTARTRFPQWTWGDLLNNYRWRPKIPRGLEAPTRWFHQDDWATFLQFCNGLRWNAHNNQITAFTELAVIFYSRGFKLSNFDPTTTTFRYLATWLRKALNQASQLDNASFFPGLVCADTRKTAGRCLPSGIIRGGFPFMSDSELLLLAQIIQEGAGKQLASWELLVVDFPL